MLRERETCRGEERKEEEERNSETKMRFRLLKEYKVKYLAFLCILVYPSIIKHENHVNILGYI
jgi:hypothetical protein